MNVNLTPELEDIVHAKVRTGRYNSASEVVREALRLMDERDQDKAIRRAEIRRKIDEGWASATAGSLHTGDEVFAELEAQLDAVERTEQR
ncbi:MAG TPA: type II toxin-antitoxin system ParD family antitoxin [Capsulimonadaceae bacterium]|jgi:antitoxin ParD1/3/4